MRISRGCLPRFVLVFSSAAHGRGGATHGGQHAGLWRKGGHMCGLVIPDHPLDGTAFGVPGTITPLVDLWTQEWRLPDHMCAVWKSEG